MNDSDLIPSENNSQTPPLIGPVPEPKAPAKPAKTFSYWARRLLACNPFYLVSAALLLYGCYQISVDPGMLHRDSLSLFFNFGSIQFYELLLAVTAIFLARRRIWYDSTLLFGLENLLLMTPFILISQGALVGQQLTEKRLTLALSLAAGILAATRMSGLKQFIRKLNFPRRIFLAGAVFLIVNTVLPPAYRVLHEGKVGTHVEAGAAYYTNEFAWLLLLPALCAIALAVPSIVHKGELWPERGWLPFGMFALWLAGTATHLYCLGYVYDFDLRGEWVVPALWVMAWIIYLRAGDRGLSKLKKTVLVVLPLLALLPAIWPAGSMLFLSLTLVNLAIYGAFCFLRRSPIALHLMMISLVTMAVGFPGEWGNRIFPEFSRPAFVWGAIAACGLFLAIRSRNPAAGVFGAMIAAGIVAAVLSRRADVVHWAIQSGLVVLLIHSLRWEDHYHPGASFLRILACGIWVVDASIWVHTTGSAWMTWCAVAPLITVYLTRRTIIGEWGPRMLPIASLLVVLSAPVDSGAMRLQTVSTGVLAVIGAFVLFAFGTLAAVMRHRWQKTVRS